MTGYLAAGYSDLLAVEWNENAVQTLKLNHPNVDTYLGNIKNISVDDVLKRTGLEPGELDVLDGSPPCQGFSSAGRRLLDDERNQLFREYTRLLEGLQPRVLVMENVSGMVKGKMKLLFAEILQELKAAGYNVTARLMDAQALGVPQRRRRMIFIGTRLDLNIEPSHPEPRRGTMTIREAIHDLPLNEMRPEIDHVWVDEVARGTKWIGPASKLRPGAKLVQDQPSVVRAEWGRPFPTITSGMEGSPPYVRSCTIHPSEARTLSIREMARAQSFPDEYRFPEPLKHGMNRIGNAVPPMMMMIIAKHIRENILA